MSEQFDRSLLSGEGALTMEILHRIHQRSGHPGTASDLACPTCMRRTFRASLDYVRGTLTLICGSCRDGARKGSVTILVAVTAPTKETNS